MIGNGFKKEYGDYQTPLSFAQRACTYLCVNMGIDPDVVIEPTCGIGNFLAASLSVFSNIKAAYGIEINAEYADECKSQNKHDKRLTIYHDDFFTFNTKKLKGIDVANTLVIGNPPWATNSELRFNLPKKSNFKGLSGTDAITGASNFDICEYIILKLVNELKGTNNTIAMLCKTAVARNVLVELSKNKIGTKQLRMLEFNAAKVFGIGASACFFIISLSSENTNSDRCIVCEIDTPDVVKDVLMCKNGVLSSELQTAEDFEGECEFTWRQGVKHDCSGVMELTRNDDGTYTNKHHEHVDIEDTYVFPLMKSSSFKKPIICDGFSKYVIVTQKKARQETRHIQEKAPKTWAYLNKHKALFEKRRSSIYNGAPAFSMFGVGDYSYAPYKVGVSGFYKKALFCLVYNINKPDQPVMGDDTSYFLAFSGIDEAYACMLLLNSKRVQDFLYSISFQDAKRPYTKKVLGRISLRKSVTSISLNELSETEKELGLQPKITAKMYRKFIAKVNTYQMSLSDLQAI